MNSPLPLIIFLLSQCTVMKFKEIQAKARDAEILKKKLKNEIMQLERAGSDDGMYRTRTNDSMYNLGKVAPPPAPAFGSKPKNTRNMCQTESECKAKSKEMKMEFINSTMSPTKGCYSRNNKVFFSPGKEEEMTTTDLSGMKVRVYCDATDDDSSSDHSNDDKKIGINRFERKPEYDKPRYPSKPKYGKPRYPLKKPSDRSEDEELSTKRESKKYRRYSPSDNKSEDRDASEEEDEDSGDASAEEDESGSEDGSFASEEEE